jgi:ABC-type dipeptide/oligopeptide/nickel transport system permease subunit
VKGRVVTALLALPGLVVAAVALLGPWLTDKAPGLIVGAPYSPPGGGFPLGTDAQGRDVWVRLLTGGRPLVLVPDVAVCLTAILGTGLGLAAGYLGGPVDAVVSRLDGLLLAIPPILVLLLILQGWGYRAVTLVAVVVVTGTPFVSRVARAATRQVMRHGYVEQAIGLGESPVGVIVREILPGILRPILADAGTRLAIAIAITASAGFLGFGPDEPNWGAMVSQNMEGITLTPWGVVAPAVLLALLAISANLGIDRLADRIGR